MTFHYLEDLEREILKDSPVQSAFFEHSLRALDESERQRLDELLGFYVSRGKSVSFLAQCYQSVVEDTLAEQIYFRKHGHYRFSTFEELKESGTATRDFWEMYFKGLGITQFLWPNHRTLYKFYAAELPRTKEGSYLEIGPGHGFLLAEALRSSAFTSFTALDREDTALKITEELVDHFLKKKSHVRFVSSEFLSWVSSETFDAIVLGEVLEHTEHPRAMLEKVHALSHPGTFIYLTTCINAPAIDHLSLFSSADELRRLFKTTGLKVEREILLPYVNTTLDQTLKQKLPLNVGFVLDHEN